MMAANYRHIGGGENRLGRHYADFRGFGSRPSLPINHLHCEIRRTQGRIGQVGLGSAAPGVASGTALARMEVLAKDVLPPGFTIEWTELSHQQEQQGIPTIAIF